MWLPKPYTCTDLQCMVVYSVWLPKPYICLQCVVARDIHVYGFTV